MLLTPMALGLQFNDFHRHIIASRSRLVMKKTGWYTVVLTCLVLGSYNPIEAQLQIQSGGRWDLINTGLGMSTRGLPVFVGIEQTLDDHLSAALLGTFQSGRESGSAGTWTHQYFGVGIQGNYHFIELAPSPFDLFAGLTLGWFSHHYKWSGAGPSPDSYNGSAIGGLGLSGQIGGRYTYEDLTFLLQMDGGTLMSGFLVGLSFPL